jgi:ATP-binding cassette subfamily B protein
MILGPYLLKTIVDTVSNPDNSSYISEALLFPIIGMFLLNLFIVGTQRLCDYIWLNLRLNIQRHLMSVLMTRVMDHSLNYYQNNFTGSILSKINDIIGAVPDIIRIFTDNIFGNILSIIISLYVLYKVNLYFSLSFIIWSLIFLFVSIKFSFYAKILAQKSAQVRSKLMGGNSDVISNMINVKLFSGKTKELLFLRNNFKRLIFALKRRDLYLLKINSFQGLSFTAFQLACILLLVYGFKNHYITPGDFVLVLTLNTSLLKCLEVLSSNIRNFTEDLGNTKQGLVSLFSPIEVQDNPDARPLVINKGEIYFENVTFSYENSINIFNKLNLKIAAGQKVGLVGFSGAGKTTFINLLLRFYDIKTGTIFIDGQDISQVGQESLRSAISVVPQDTSLFHRSILSNIRYGMHNASEQEVIEAAKKANAHDFIMKFPEGYFSMVGDRGIKLSGGQRQRIAIARAFIKKSPILILDEPTSQLDATTESLVQQSLKRLIEEGTTVLVIAHRLTTLQCMERILVFKEGEIVEDNAPEVLLSYESLYRHMWEKQIGGYLAEELKY